MNYTIRYYILFFLLPVFSCVFAQQMSVTTLPLNNYLPSSSVLRVHCDKEGFLWLGTKDGLCRYDAYRILTFRSGLKTPDLLTNNEITCIAEDDKGFLYIGTKKGLNILNKQTYQIIPVEHNDLKDQEIRTMIVDSKGWLWVGTLTSVFRCSSDFSFCKRYDASLPVTSVNSFYEDLDKNIWVTLWQRGLHKYDSEKDSFVSLPKIGLWDNPFKVFQDDKRQHWVLTWESGIYLFYPEEKQEMMYNHVNIERENKWDESGCYSIVQDDKYGYIWIVSTQGLYALQKRPGDMVSNVDISHISSKLNNIFSEIVKDAFGNLWIAAFNEGVSMIDLNKPFVQNNSLPTIRKKTGFNANVKNIYEDEDGDLWINQNRWGVGILKPNSTDIQFHTDIPSLNGISNLKNISCIAPVSSLHEVWLGIEYDSEIYRVKKENGKMQLLGTLNLKKYVTENPGDPYLFYEDSKRNFWIITTTGNILVKPAGKNDIQDTHIMLKDITGIGEGKDNTLWISTKKQGVYTAVIPPQLQFKKSGLKNLTSRTDGLISNNITAICVDDNGLIWLGSEEGSIFTYDSQKKKITNLSNVFDMLEESIFNIVTDRLGHIWISTNKRIIEYEPKNGGIMDYSTMDDILVNSFMPNSYFIGRSGKMYYGGNRGITAFTPYECLSEHPQNIKTMIADVKIDGMSTLLEKNNNRFDLSNQNIILNSGDKNIEIDFSSLNYAFPDKIKYAYKMEGVDDNWVYVKGDRQFAFYNQLPKGKRTFYLKATDVNGLWSEYISKVSIYKQPAFYETWWAYTLYAIFIIICIYLFYRRMQKRMQLRHELKIAQIDREKSEELAQMKLRYFTNISHDLLTPLTIITCLVDDAELISGERIPQLNMIRSNVNKLKRLLQQILDFRKVESGNMRLSLSQGDIIPFVSDVCSVNFAPLMKKKKQTFVFSVEEETLIACFDADKVDKIVSNLLSNACKHTDAGGEIKLMMKSYQVSGCHHLCIQVSDTGEGIASEELENIFARFYTAHKKDSSESNGIGLSLTKDLVELHHGSIKVESELGKGSVFTVDFPIDKESYKENEFAIEKVKEKKDEVILGAVYLDESEEADTDMHKTNEHHLLLVEDNEELLYLMKRILSRNYHVLIAKNGVEALEIVKENEIDIVISDVMMPEMDGLELCRNLKSDLETSHIPVILLTAKNTVEDRVECYNAGADGYIAKPFELKILEARINNFISHKRSKQEEFRFNADAQIDALETSVVDKEFFDKVVSVIKTNISEGDFDVVQLADALAVSKSSLYRKMKVATGLSPIEFIRNIRLKHGSQLLRNRSIPVAEVAYECGFSNPKYFATCFKGEFGVTPKEYQKTLK